MAFDIVGAGTTTVAVNETDFTDEITFGGAYRIDAAVDQPVDLIVQWRFTEGTWAELTSAAPTPNVGPAWFEEFPNPDGRRKGVGVRFKTRTAPAAPATVYVTAS